MLTVSVSSTPPAINEADIANLAQPGPGAGASDPGGDPGHIWSNRPIQGQRFTTGSHSGGYNLRAVTLQNEENTVNNNTNGFTVRVGAITGTTFTQLRSQFANNSVSYVPNNYITFTFATPVTLQPNTTYGFDWDASGTGFTTWNNADTAYAGGTGYSSGTNGVPNDTALVFRNIDRVFHIDMVQNGAPTTLRVVTANPTSGQTLGVSPPTATFDFNYSVTAGTVAASDLLVDGNPATGVTIVDADTLRFDLPNLNPGNHTYSIAAAALTGTGAIPFEGFSGTFTTVQVAEKSISINFEGRPSGASIQVAPGGVAGVSPTIGWNNIEGTTNVSGSFGPFAITGKNGEQATVLWSATGTYSTTANGQRNLTTLPLLNNHANMMDGHIEGDTIGQASATVSGLADDYNKYDVYVYVGDDAGNRLGELRFNGGPVQTFTSKIFDGTYTVGRDYFLFEDVTGDSFVVTVEPQNDNTANRTGIRGIQIIGLETMEVTSTIPAEDAVIAASPTTVRVNFNHPYVFSSVQITDLIVDGGAVGVTDVSQVDGDTLEFTLDGTLAPGPHTIGLPQAALLGPNSLPLEPFSGTFTVAALASIQNTAPPAFVDAISARLGGVVTNTGFDVPAVTLYYGSTDGGTSAGAWQHAVPMGMQSGGFSSLVSGLSPQSTYYFRTAAQNVAGVSWAAQTASFTTPAVTPPAVTLLGSSNVASSSARLGGQITATGGQPPVVTFFYGDNDGGTNSATWDNFVSVGTQSDVFSSVVGNLSPETTYYFRARATNDAGTAWTSVGTFTTTPFVPATVVINEIHYNPDLSTEAVEFLELFNAGDEDVNLGGWYFSDGIDYVFPPGTILGSGDYIVVAENPAALQAKYGAVSLGPYTGKLANDGEEIVLRDASGLIRDEVDYQLGFPWPTVGGSPGYSMELVNPSLDNDLGGSWRASTGSDDPIPGGDVLVASEGVWQYFKGTQEPSAPGAWRQIGFNDTAPGWLTGAAAIGYGDAHVETVLSDMQGTYSTVYLRKTFTLADADAIAGLRLEAQFDDGINVWINGFRVLTENVLNAETPYNGTAIDAATEDNTFRQFALTNPANYLVDGTNVIAVQLLNASLGGSGDAWFDARLVETAGGPGGGAGPTPGGINSMYLENPAPQMRQVDHSPNQPATGEDVTITIKATDPDGVAGVTLDYQLVNPGNYIRITDPAYQTSWTTVTMRDDGTEGDDTPGDDIYTVVLPGNLQTDRRLVRYRITATDTQGAEVRGPYADDPQPNFAYFVYDGVPDWTGSLRPGVAPAINYTSDSLTHIAVYQLIANETDINNSQYNSGFNLQQFRGTFVYDGKVYDHIEFRNRGRASNYQVGKNKWKINFTRGHALEARDNYGRLYDEPLDKINILPGTNPWWRNDVSTDGTVLFEPVAFKLYDLAGAPSPHTNFFHFRVVDSAVEASPTSQYEGDFWGLYTSIEQPEGEFLRERDLPDGNIFNMHGVAGATQRSQGSLLPTDKSDLTAFVNGYKSNQTLAWWDQNLNYESYFAWAAINRAANNSDVRPEENVNYYHNQENGQWYTIPWDLDLTFEDALHHNRPPSTIEDIDNVFAQHPSVRLAYANFVRELRDLLFDSGDAALVVEELANVLEPGFNMGTQEANTIVEANQAMWDYHPRKVKPGIWYKNFTPALLPQQTFDGLVAYMQNFLRPGGYGYNVMVADSVDAAIPNRPTITYTGPLHHPLDGLTFQTNAFSDPQGAGTFAAMEWRVAEIHNADLASYDPTDEYRFEIEGTWESGEITTYANQITVPPLAAEAGKTYRARVRMKDNTGRWSHWSLPVEFTASPPTPTDVTRFLRVSEINYHPATDGDAEFIELTNISSGPSAVMLDLTDVAITEGPNNPFVFPEGTTLAPGEYILVVRDMAVFTATYPHVDPSIIAGEYSGGLDNSGERIEIIDPQGNFVHDFRYEDGGDPGEEAWHPSTDGLGPTLVIADVNDSVNQWSVGAGWRASFASGGSPGEADCPAGDVNCDGAVNLADLGILQSHLGMQSGATRAQGDLSGDGAVSRRDAVLFALAFGSSAPGVGAPSPSAVVTAAATRERRVPEVAAQRRLDRQAVDRLLDSSSNEQQSLSQLRARRSAPRAIASAVTQTPALASGGWIAR